MAGVMQSTLSVWAATGPTPSWEIDSTSGGWLAYASQSSAGGGAANIAATSSWTVVGYGTDKSIAAGYLYCDQSLLLATSSGAQDPLVGRYYRSANLSANSAVYTTADGLSRITLDPVTGDWLLTATDSNSTSTAINSA